MAVRLVDTVEECRMFADYALSQAELALDLEGVELCRDGPIALIQFCTQQGEVFLVDIAELGQAAFDQGGLRAVLESPHIVKVIYDGRADADALYHRHWVNLQGAYDLQVLHALQFTKPYDVYLKGLSQCLDDAVVVPLWEKNRARKVKDLGRSLFVAELGGTSDAWMHRPLPPILVEYAALDVKYLLPVQRLWGARHSAAVLRVTEARLRHAMLAPEPAKGRHKRFRDFTLGSAAQFRTGQFPRDEREIAKWYKHMLRQRVWSNLPLPQSSGP